MSNLGTPLAESNNNDSAAGSAFNTPLMRQFIEYVHAGLPEQFLQNHPDLLRVTNLVNSIRRTVEQVPDKALRDYLMSRIEAIETYRQDRTG